MPTSRPVCVPMLMFLLAFCTACQDASESTPPDETEPIAEQAAALKTISVRPLAPDKLPNLGYWPFAKLEVEGVPGLTRVGVDVKLTSDGCGGFAWNHHPVPGSDTPGPFCVGLVEGVAKPLLVVARRGESPDLLVPFVIELGTGQEGERVMAHHRPIRPLPALTNAIKRWAEAPGGGR